MSGFWNGDRFCLREFNATSDCAETDDGLQWSQSMAKLRLNLVLEGELASLTQDDFKVELSEVDIKVTVAGRSHLNSALKAINGDFLAAIDRETSWWAIEDRGEPTLTVELGKQELKNWTKLWFVGGMNPLRKRSFSFNGGEPVRQMPDQKGKDMKPGRPTSGAALEDDGNELSLFSGLRAYGGLCLDPMGGQSATHLEICIPLEPESLRRVTSKLPLNDLFGIDISETHLQVFIRDKDQKTLIAGEFGGRVSPQDTVWQVTNTHVEDMAEQVQALEIRFTKASDSKFMWDHIFNEDMKAGMKRAKLKRKDGLKGGPRRVDIFRVTDLISTGKF